MDEKEMIVKLTVLNEDITLIMSTLNDAMIRIEQLEEKVTLHIKWVVAQPIWEHNERSSK